MERLRGPINSFIFGEEMRCEMDYSSQMPFLQMLQGAMQVEDETEEETEETQFNFQILDQQQPPQYPLESNLQLLLRFQNHQHLFNQAAEQPLDSCITNASESQSAAKWGKPSKPMTPIREKKKRKRSRAPSSSKNAEEVESQRRTHIAVERNRRRLMNSHLVALRSLMPASFVQRGDQASIIGGAIDFVKELEQLLLSLQAEKRTRTAAEPSSPCTATSSRSSEEEENAAASLEGFFVSPQYTSYSEYCQQRARRRGGGGGGAGEEEELGVDVEATVVQGHVNLKVAGRRRAGQLVKAVAALEELRLSVLHLNITSMDHSSVLYSLNLKIEEDCKLGSAEEIATAVHQIFTYINAC